VDTSIVLDGVKRVAPRAELITLAGEKDAANTFEHPDLVAPVHSEIDAAPEFKHTIPAMSVQCIRIGVGQQPQLSSGNPIFKDVFTADPTALAVGDTLYVYVGHDEAKDGEMFNMKEWLCYSTQDMRTWTSHGPVLRPTDFKWAVRDAWASHVTEKDGKFYFYTTVQHDKTKPGKAIGVAVSDSPTGPFVDARGSALITDDMTPSDRHWDDIDPAVFIDDDGTAWMFWGNPYLYYVRLKPNMIEIDGSIGKVDVPNYTEGPWLHKRGDIYYLTYAAFAHQGMAEKICYATAPSITGPWTYQGILTGHAKNSYTIHPAIVEFKGQWYFFYHNAALTIDGVKGALGRRSVCVEYLYYNPDGTIQPITQTVEGVSLPPKPMASESADSAALPVQAECARNPVIWADVPDIAMIRVGDTYYMSSTTMHMSPGLPIMKSKDLVNWELVGYAYDTLADNEALRLENGRNAYGAGSWASSLRYHDGTFYASTFSSTTGKTHVYTTKNIEIGPWTEVAFSPSLHDHTLFFDDDGRVYMIYGVGDIRLIELSADASGIKPGGMNRVIIPNASLVAGGRVGLPAEGSQMIKVDGKYYLFNITWPRGDMRTQIVHRADTITGPYEGRVVLRDQGRRARKHHRHARRQVVCLPVPGPRRRGPRALHRAHAMGRRLARPGRRWQGADDVGHPRRRGRTGQHRRFRRIRPTSRRPRLAAGVAVEPQPGPSSTGRSPSVPVGCV
jgi:beta-xylosidase